MPVDLIHSVSTVTIEWDTVTAHHVLIMEVTDLKLTTGSTISKIASTLHKYSNVLVDLDTTLDSFELSGQVVDNQYNVLPKVNESEAF